MDESTKAKRFWTDLEKEVTRGEGIDIGSGGDPVLPNCRCFDVQHGDANEISRYVTDQFDFVYSSHCLEHMHQPRATIVDWWKLVRPGGHLFIVVPDEDLYEQGVFPSRFNPDHKATFTISKASSWSPVSHNLLELAGTLPNSKLISLALQDRGYDRTLLSFGERIPNLKVRALAKVAGLMAKIPGRTLPASFRQVLTAYYPVDQTSPPYNAQAQIQLIVQKAPAEA